MECVQTVRILQIITLVISKEITDAENGANNGLDLAKMIITVIIIGKQSIRKNICTWNFGFNTLEERKLIDMEIKLKEIDKDTLKVGDWIGIAREVSYGWCSSFRHKLIYPAKITRITPKRTKFFTDKFGEHDKREIFYECDDQAARETFLAKAFRDIQDGIFELTELKRNDYIGRISDEDLPEVAKHMEAMMKILKKYKEN